MLAGRAVVYQLSPTPLALHFQRAAGGPGLPLVTIVALAGGLALACAVLWIAAAGVRERRALDARQLEDEPPRLRPAAVLLRAAALFAVTSLSFALLESTIHWRAGLGWHGLDCLVGPVHRDALPILLALSLVASALAAALQHVVRWMRRTVALLRGGALRLRPIRFTVPLPVRAAPAGRLAWAPCGARGPPLPTG